MPYTARNWAAQFDTAITRAVKFTDVTRLLFQWQQNEFNVQLIRNTHHALLKWSDTVVR